MNSNKLNEISRRGFLATTAKSCFGLTIGGAAAHFFTQNSYAADPSAVAAGGGKAKSVIYLFMSGGMTHLDTFDPKPDAASNIRGDCRAISTNVDGIQLGHCLPKLAKQMDHVALIRSMTSTQGAHAQGRYFMRTGYAQRSSIVHPSAGAWAARLGEKPTGDLPGYVTVNCGSDHPGAGFMEAQYAPLPIGDATAGLQNSHRRGVSEGGFEQQLTLRKQLDAEFDARFIKGQKNVRDYNEAFDAAVRLMKSKDLEAFDLSQEGREVHKLYGASRFSKGLLLARRLVEHGVRFIEVEFGGFDWHVNNFGLMEEKIPILDQALAALLQDLEIKGLLDSTLVVLGTEFGRSPEVNENAGRNHYPKAFSTLMAGGGIKGGQAYGSTDATGSSIISGNKILAPDFNATIAHALGLPYDKIIESPSKRPFRMGGRKGKPVTQLFA